MSAKKITLKTMKWGITGLLTTGAILAIGFLSYCGMLVIHPSIGLAWVAFALAGFIDGEVYLQNIKNGIENLKLLGRQGVDSLILHTLEHSLEEQLKKTPDEMSEFAKDYCAQRKYIASFENKKLSATQEIEKAQAQKRLRRMQKLFIADVFANKKETKEQSVVAKKLPVLQRKIVYLRLCVPACIGAGVGFGFATASALQAALVGTALAASAAAIWPLAAIACAAYAFIIYQTLSDMICHETFGHWRKKITSWFKRETLENGLKKPIDSRYILRVMGISALLILTIGVGIIATLATAGTWWLAVKNGAALLPVMTSGANIIRNVLVPIASAANLAFTIRNSLNTVKQLVHATRKKNPLQHLREKSIAIAQGVWDVLHTNPLRFIQDKKQQHAKHRTWGELLNPFKIIAAIISAPFLFIIFVGHLASIGLVGDRAPGLNYVATVFSAIFGAISDGFVDFPYILGCEDHHDHAHGSEEAHEHSHGLIAKTILALALSPILIASAAWDFCAQTPDQTLSKWERFIRNVKVSFGIPLPNEGNPSAPPPLSDTYLKNEMHYRFAKQKTRLQHTVIDTTVAQDKIHCLETIESNLLENKIPDSKDYTPILNKPRQLFHSSYNLFSSSSCTTQRAADKIIADYQVTPRRGQA